MIIEIRLQSNNGASTARFWSAVFDLPAEELGGGAWRCFTPAPPRSDARAGQSPSLVTALPISGADSRT